MPCTSSQCSGIQNQVVGNTELFTRSPTGAFLREVVAGNKQNSMEWELWGKTVVSWFRKKEKGLKGSGTKPLLTGR